MDIKGFAEAVNESRLAVEEGKIIIITKKGAREEHYIDSEIIGSNGLFGTSIDWKTDGKKMFKQFSLIKSVNGISVSKFN